jgi:hypothetical protein
MQVIPIQDVPNQQFQVTLSKQQCTINLYENSQGLFCDLYVSNNLIIAGVICQNKNRIVRDSYLGFVGDLSFIDSQGTSDPTYPGLGTRYLFCYLDTFDLPVGVG